MAGAVIVILAGAGAVMPLVIDLIPEKKPTPYETAIGKANSLCASLWGLHPIALQPKGLVFTFVDLGPRLITLTHHDAIAGPYHRNFRQIVDVMNAWRGSEPQAHRIIVEQYHSDYVLICPNSSTTTIFTVRDAERILRAAGARTGAKLASAGTAAEGLRRTRCGGWSAKRGRAESFA